MTLVSGRNEQWTYGHCLQNFSPFFTGWLMVWDAPSRNLQALGAGTYINHAIINQPKPGLGLFLGCQAFVFSKQLVPAKLVFARCILLVYSHEICSKILIANSLAHSARCGIWKVVARTRKVKLIRIKRCC